MFYIGYLIRLSTTFEGKYFYYLHCTDGENEAQQVNDLPEVAQLETVGQGGGPHFSDSKLASLLNCSATQVLG